MHHVAIMKKSWGLIPKILSKEKIIESRWYKVKYKPWNLIKAGETIYFKNSGEPVKLKAEVKKVMQFSGLDPKKIREILNKYGKADGIEKNQINRFYKLFKGKKYCLLIFLKKSKKVKPFDIDKTGFGAMSSWLTVSNIAKIKKCKQF
ncbi:hypothetical protein A3A09_02780 [Candidatus Nomurabacteria bacterium RIFCSPLOWO2_01_FULL_42_20]|nr:MAG: hypothetical protein A3A09_02780 [Candidatus Nomurabacteria bacterium RIFCSPLOWO2_01_FULL_42_20]